jgi:hypothetical protein
MARPATAAVRLLTGEREPCRLATTANIDVDAGGLLVIDGVQTEVGDRILVKDQTDGSENGIRTVSAGQWYRAADARTARTMQKGTTVHVAEGTTSGGKTFVFNTLEPVIGDSDIEIVFYLSDDTLGDVAAAVAAGVADIGAAGDAEIAEVQASGEPIVAAAEAAKDAAEAAAASLNLPTILAGYTKRILQVNPTADGYELVPLTRATTPPGIVLNDSTPSIADANRAAIQAVLDDTGPGDAILLPNGPIYVADAGLDVFNAQFLGGLSPSGDIFGANPVAGTALIWAGSSGEPYLLDFGADPNAVAPVQTFGGGIGNLQLDGNYNVDRVLRMAACGRARFGNIKAMRPTNNGLVADGNAAIWLGANATVAGLENTIRHCDFKNVFAFAYGSGHAFYNKSNGTEGGLTFCSGKNLRADFGYGTGGGHGFYFSSMDDCTFEGVTGSRAAGGTGQGLYLNGNGVSGIVCVGNTFKMVKLSGGAPVVADGRHSGNNIIIGLSGVDEVPTVIESNDGWVDVFYLGTGYGDTPGSVTQQPTTVRRKDAANNAVSRLLTLRHGLNATASAPAIGIGVEQVFEALTAAGNFEFLAAIQAITTSVTPTSEAAKLVFRLLTAGALADVITLTPTLMSMIGVNPAYYIESSGAGAGASAGLKAKTANHANVWQAIAKAGGFVIGVDGVADYTAWSTTGDISHAAHFSIATGKEYRVNAVKVVGGRDTGWTAGTGTANKGAFAAYAGQTHTGSYVQATVQALDDATKAASQRIRAIEAALITHGLIGT